jgi:hypothetical protein
VAWGAGWHELYSQLYEGELYKRESGQWPWRWAKLEAFRLAAERFAPLRFSREPPSAQSGRYHANVIWPPGERPDWTISLTYESINGRAECIGLALEPHWNRWARPRVVTHAAVRKIPLGRIMRIGLSGRNDRATLEREARIQVKVKGGVPIEWLGVLHESKPTAPETRGRGRPPLEEDFLREVATIYKSDRRAPIRAVQDYITQTKGRRPARRTVQGWLERCEALGLLQKSERWPASSTDERSTTGPHTLWPDTRLEP